MNLSEPYAGACAVRQRDALRASESAGQRTSLDDSSAVDVVVPVYGGPAQTRRCLESVLGGASLTPFRVAVVNDASPHPVITEYLRELAAMDARVELIENSANVGFVTSVNRGMALSRKRDVVLLNSDTEVAGDWLDRLRRAAYQSDRTATVTPFSNNATICSYPRFCEDNPLPRGVSVAELDCIFASVNADLTIPIPTAVGFCMYIRRACLNEVGLFDADNFGRGYGEENDFCMRATKAGWRHVLAAGIFVAHAGGVSFGAEKDERVRDAQETLRRLHPEYEQLVGEHIAADPASAARRAVDVAFMRAVQACPQTHLKNNPAQGRSDRGVESP